MKRENKVLYMAILPRPIYVGQPRCYTTLDMPRITAQNLHVKDTHEARRASILEKHPEVKKLMVVEPRTKYWITLNVVLQLAMSVLSTYISDWRYFFVYCYVVGATLAHSLFLAIHEVSHNSAFRSVQGNQLLGMFANLPIAIPYSATFRRYHLQHHFCIGEDIDCDLPTPTESYLVSFSSTCYIDHVIRKTLYLSTYTLFYALRPIITHPEIFRFDNYCLANTSLQILFDLAMYHLLGVKPLIYMLLSTFLAGSLHPLSGRFISEHLVVQESDKVETYSYYGPLNDVLWQIGHHNEHHDFPNIPYTKLPALKKIAPEYYTALPQTKGWLDTTLIFLFDDSIGPHCRVRRKPSS